MELNFPSSYHVNWPSCLVYFPIEEACYVLHLKEFLQKHPQVYLREAEYSTLSAVLNTLNPEEKKRVYLPQGMGTDFPQYSIVKKTRPLQKRGAFIVVNLSSQNTSFYQLEEKLKIILKDSEIDFDIQTQYFFNIHSRVDPRELLNEFKEIRKLIQRLTPHYKILPFNNIFSTFKDFQKYKIFDLGSEKLVYLNSLYLWSLKQGATVDAYQDQSEWSLNPASKFWKKFRDDEAWSLYHFSSSNLE